MDIQLKGKLDGIETAKIILESADIPIIYLTSNTDDHHFNRAKSTRPYAFISKPFKRLDLKRAIELTLARMVEENSEKKNDLEEDSSFILNDRLFIRDKGKMLKILIEDISFVEAERNYSKIYTLTKSFLISLTLKNMEERLPNQHFLRIHRSFIVNCAQIDSVSEMHLMIGKKLIPISKNLKPELLRRLNTL
jgi:DNA-binding LytR/AlgR family response regulator